MNPQIRFFLTFIATFVAALLFYQNFVPIEVDVLYVNGRIYTLDEQNTVVDALATRGERIAAVGNRADLESKLRPRSVIDLQGNVVFPGFIDAHAHLLSLGLARLTVNLVGARSELEAVERVRDRVVTSEPGRWIRGRGWDQNLWPSKQFPNARMLDRVAPENPVYLGRVDGHATWVNTRALELAGVTKDTPDPPGGRIMRDVRGNPTGVFVDAAMELIQSHLPPLSERESREVAELAIKECLRYGLTTVHDMGVAFGELDLYKRMIDENAFDLRVYAAIGGAGETWDYFRSIGPMTGYANKLTVRAIKLYIDGALGSRGAALVEPYEDDPGNRGLTLTSDEEFRNVVSQALKSGFQVCTHAIGDRGNNIALNGYESSLKEHSVADHRLRIEHAQVLQAADIPRFKQLGVIPSMQPTHCTSDMFWAEARLGPERVHGAYVWRSLLDDGNIIAGGSDFPVEHANPLYGIYSAVTRQDHLGRPNNAGDVARFFQLSKHGIKDPNAHNGGWYAIEKITRLEAIRAFTTWPAIAGFEEKNKGSLEKGKLADLVVLSKDILAIDPKEILSTKVVMTILGGQVVYGSSLGSTSDQSMP